MHLGISHLSVVIKSIFLIPLHGGDSYALRCLKNNRVMFVKCKSHKSVESLGEKYYVIAMERENFKHENTFSLYNCIIDSEGKKVNLYNRWKCDSIWNNIKKRWNWKMVKYAAREKTSILYANERTPEIHWGT